MGVASYHLSVKAISRSAGRSATAAIAYRAGVAIRDERTQELHDYSRRGGVDHSYANGIALPEEAPVWAHDREALWNAAEMAETRKNSTVAREFEIALPAQLSPEGRHALVTRFSKEIAAEHGIAVEACIHLPSRNGDQRNHHAHILTSTRRLGANGFGEKARELDDQRTGAHYVEKWRRRFAELGSDALRAEGFVLEAERFRHGHMTKEQQLQKALHRGDFQFFSANAERPAAVHLGPAATGFERRTGEASQRREDAECFKSEMAIKIEERPELILEQITRTKAVFSRQDVARELNRYIDDSSRFGAILARLDASKELVNLTPDVSRNARYSTREMIAVEIRMADAGETMAGVESHKVAGAILTKIFDRHTTLSAEQRNAIEHITRDGQLACLIGDAGTGKSFALNAAREAWEAAGYRVRGAALAGKAADGLREGSGIESRTLVSLERSWTKGYGQLQRSDVLVIDEAGMIGARQLDRVLAAAKKAGAKVVLIGDDKQLAAIEAGAPFRALVERTGAAEITEIRRQKEAWARQASQSFARAKDGVRVGLDAYRKHEAVYLLESRETARAAIADAWMKGRNTGNSIILAHTQNDVRNLNEAVRSARRATGDLGEEITFATDTGRQTFAAGDRVVFLKNDSTIDVKNGTLGTVVAGRDGALTVRLDSDKGRMVEVDERAFGALSHGYAVTIHKAQGVTVDRTYVLASGGMDRALTYVAMTRHREHAELFAGRDDFQNYEVLTRRLGRGQVKESTLDYAQRRGDDRKSLLEDLRHLVERGRERLGQIAERGATAMHSLLAGRGREHSQEELLKRLQGISPVNFPNAKPSETSDHRAQPGKKMERLRAGHTSEATTSPSANPLREGAPSAMEAYERTITQSIGERRAKAMRLVARLEIEATKVNELHRRADIARPLPPRGLGAMFSKSQIHEQVEAWRHKVEQIRRRALTIANRLRKVREFAQPGHASISPPARRLALKKVARRHPALHAEVNAIRLAQQQAAATKMREQLTINASQGNTLKPRRR